MQADVDTTSASPTYLQTTFTYIASDSGSTMFTYTQAAPTYAYKAGTRRQTTALGTPPPRIGWMYFIALPLALALGIASVPSGTGTPYPPPAIGLFTAIFAGLVISSLGGCRVQIGGPTAAFIPIVLLIIEKHGYSGLILATLMAGGILIAMGFARMGTLIKFIPWPVTSGFTTGIAVSIMATQAADFLGIHAETPPPREFLHKLQWIWENLSHSHRASLGLALACLLLINFWPRLGIKRVPGSIVQTPAAAAAVALFGLEQKLGLETIGSKFGPGAIPLGSRAWDGACRSCARARAGPRDRLARERRLPTAPTSAGLSTASRTRRSARCCVWRARSRWRSTGS